MPTIRERVAGALFRPEMERLDRAMRATAGLADLIREHPQTVLDLREMDDETLRWIVSQQREGWEVLGQLGGRGWALSEQARLLAVKQSRRQVSTDPNAEHQLTTWTDYGFGQHVDIDLPDEQAQEVWQEFWTANRNGELLGERNLHELSNTLLQDGEMLLTLWSDTVAGRSTLRLVLTDQLVNVLTDPQDAYLPLYYERRYTLAGDGSASPVTIYYPHHQRTPDELARADLPRDARIAGQDSQLYLGGDGDGRRATEVRAMHLAYLRKGLPRRGWPLLTSSRYWLDAYRDWLKAREAVAQLVYLYVDQIKAKGGSRAVDHIIRNVQSDLVTGGFGGSSPRATPGSAWVSNEALDRTRNPLTTGAADAEKDSAALLAMAGGAGRFPPMFLGRGELVRMAVAEQMMEPIRRQWQRYQSFWRSVWADLVRMVLSAHDAASNTALAEVEPEINLDLLVEPELDDLARALDAVVGITEFGALDLPTTQRVMVRVLRAMMSKLGIADMDPIFGEILDRFTNQGPVAVGDEEPQSTEEEVAEVGDRPFAESAAGGYGRALRGAVRGYWRGDIDYTGFYEAMMSAIRRYLRLAWQEGAQECGIAPDELSEAEKAALEQATYSEMAYIDGLARAIEGGSKAQGGKLGPLLVRTQMWENRYRDVMNRAKSMACADRKLKWVVHPEKEHCSSCLKLDGKVKRASFWYERGIRPQMPELECGGWRCGCEFVVTDEPLSRGPLPSIP